MYDPQVNQHRTALTEARAELAYLQTELSANDGVLAEAESALVIMVGEKEALEQKVANAYAAERLAAEAAETLRMQVAALQARLEGPSATALEAETFGGISGTVYDVSVSAVQVRD